MVAELGYASGPLTRYLSEFYRTFPRCDFSSLQDHLYRLVDCSGCGCIYQDPVPTDEFLASFYRDGLYGVASPAPVPVQPYQFEQAARELAMVVRFLQPRVPRPAVLDFGTGHGQWVRMAAAAGSDAHACDVSEHAFHALTAAGITCHRIGVLPDAAFDFINTEQVLEHLPRPAETVAGLVRALRPGGVLKIGVPHDPALRTKLQRPQWTAAKDSPDSLNAVAPIEHLNHFEPASLTALGRAAGLEPLRIAGWDLSRTANQSFLRGPGARIARWLRDLLGESYRPYFVLTQTAFFQKPPPAA